MIKIVFNNKKELFLDTKLIDILNGLDNTKWLTEVFLDSAYFINKNEISYIEEIAEQDMDKWEQYKGE